MEIDYNINDGSGYTFPGIEHNAFEKNKKDIRWFVPNDNLDEIRRLDYISLLSLNDDECTNFLTKIIVDYSQDLKKYGLSYKDHIFNRFYFKKFYIRERVRDQKNLNNKQIRYYYYELSDYGSIDKKFDDRILSISVYTSEKNNVIFEGCWQIFVSHIAFIFADIITKGDKLDTEGLDDNIPMYFMYTFYDDDENLGDENVLIDNVSGNLPCNYYALYNKKYFNRYVSAYAGDDFDKDLEYNNKLFYDFFSQAITRFVAFNYYMINKVEEEQEVSMDNFETSSTIVECVKSRAYMDKKIRINLDRDYDIRLNINPKRRNIYSHNNKVIRRLCDYKFQVCAHWHSYWYGSKNKPEERHKERKWVEAYYKNEDKEFNIIKERYKEKGGK